MAKQSNQKLKLLYLLRILFEQTDENSGLTITQISAELAKYNVSAARKSLYDDIEALRLFGIDIGVKRDRYVKYYIAKRDISSVELKYIVDALKEFDALPPSACYELACKLIKDHGGKVKNYSGLFEEPINKTPKAVSDILAKNIEILDNAILNGKKIYCKQFEWNSLKQRTLLYEGRRILLSPIRLVCDRKYLLYAYDGKNISTYDVSTLVDVEISKHNSAPFDEYRHLLNDPRYDVEYENVRLEISNCFAGEAFTKFGFGVTVLATREESFEISIRVKLDGDFFSWIFNNAKYVRIVSPERVRDIYKQKLLLALDNNERNV
ncbi:MAG: WYL domain-containing protein [Ruminococcaceae bacterium]|nr:WYL domain-containing protein [Oscillospiraceae bacterium]